MTIPHNAYRCPHSDQCGRQWHYVGTMCQHELQTMRSTTVLSAAGLPPTEVDESEATWNRIDTLTSAFESHDDWQHYEDCWHQEEAVGRCFDVATAFNDINGTRLISMVDANDIDFHHASFDPETGVVIDYTINQFYPDSDFPAIYSPDEWIEVVGAAYAEDDTGVPAFSGVAEELDKFRFQLEENGRTRAVLVDPDDINLMDDNIQHIGMNYSCALVAADLANLHPELSVRQVFDEDGEHIHTLTVNQYGDCYDVRGEGDWEGELEALRDVHGTVTYRDVYPAEARSGFRRQLQPHEMRIIRAIANQISTEHIRTS